MSGIFNFSKDLFNKDIVKKYWGWLALRGIISLIFAAFLFIWPLQGIFAMALVWGFFIMADGITCIIAGRTMRHTEQKSWPYYLWGGVGILAGFIAVVYPGITVIVLLSIIAIWAIVGGFLQILTAIKQRHITDSFSIALFFGILSIVFGLILFIHPLEWTIAIVWLIAFYAALSGFTFLSIALKLRRA